MVPAFRSLKRDQRVLLVSYGAGHIAKIAPVMTELRDRGVECLLIALTIGYKRAEQLALNPLGYKDLVHLTDDPAAIVDRGRSLMSGNTHPDVDPLETACYLGVNYQQWVDELGERGAEEFYAQHGRHGFLPTDFMGRVLDDLQPGVVVATSTPRSEEACIRAAVQRGIPTLTMVDLFAPESDPFLKRPVHADVVTVISHEVRAAFVAAGFEPERVHVTGSPDFDALFDDAAERRGAEFLRAKGWEGVTVVMWAGILEPEDDDVPAELSGSGLASLVEASLREWVRSRDDVALIVRYHPAQYHRFDSFPDQERVYVSDSGNEPVSFLLHATDIVINQVSTVGFEAAALGKRVLNLGFSAWVNRADFDLSSLGPSERVPTPGELISALESTRCAADDDTMSVPAGRAAPRVADLVLELLDKE